MPIYETHPLLKALALAFIANQGYEKEFREFICMDRTKLGEWMLEEFDRFISELRVYRGECDDEEK